MSKSLILIPLSLILTLYSFVSLAGVGEADGGNDEPEPIVEVIGQRINVPSWQSYANLLNLFTSSYYSYDIWGQLQQDYPGYVKDDTEEQKCLEAAAVNHQSCATKANIELVLYLENTCFISSIAEAFTPFELNCSATALARKGASLAQCDTDKAAAEAECRTGGE